MGRNFVRVGSFPHTNFLRSHKSAPGRILDVMVELKNFYWNYSFFDKKKNYFMLCKVHVCMCVCVCVCLAAKLYLTFATPMDCSPPGSSVRGFPRQEYCSGLPFPSPGDLSDPGIKHASPALQENSLLIHQGSPMQRIQIYKVKSEGLPTWISKIFLSMCRYS